jgi:hypothetical protein
VGTFAALGLWVKTLDLGLVDGGSPCNYPLGGIIVELYSPRSWSGAASWQALVLFVLFRLSLMCF